MGITNKIINYDSYEYRKYHSISIFEKSLFNLIGIIEGIKADYVINETEKHELINWCKVNEGFKNKEPLRSIIKLIDQSLSDEILTHEEIDDILWVCKNYKSDSPYFGLATITIQELHGILHGIICDGKINKQEIKELKEWMNANDFLESTYPYDEVYSLIHKILEDGKIDLQEEKMLMAFFSEFIDSQNSLNIDRSYLSNLRKEMKIEGICSLAPNLEIQQKTFCFTGTSEKATRFEIAKKIATLGGLFSNNLTKEVDYLIIGNNGNPCWAYSCYGRKVEKAMNMRKEGHKILLVNELDFWDALVI